MISALPVSGFSTIVNTCCYHHGMQVCTCGASIEYYVRKTGLGEGGNLACGASRILALCLRIGFGGADCVLPEAFVVLRSGD